ncbi:MAG: glycosyltransferase family 2 protein [Solirubrobacterales bacterium]
MPAASVIVPARNAAATIGASLAGLAAQDLEDAYEVIVVDNGSEDETGAVAAAAPGPVRVIRTAGGMPGAARNRGVEAARAGSIAFTDADCVPTPGWLRAGLAALTEADLVQGAVWPDPEAGSFPFDRTVSVAREAGLYETASLFVSRPLFERVGGFEDVVTANIAAPFGEDVWFGWKARRAGARTAFCGEAAVHHAVFRRGPAEYVAERLRTAYFPALVKSIPELRRTFLWRRAFLSRRSAAFDLALAGVAIAAATATPLPLAASAPYLWLMGRDAARWRFRAPLAAVAELAADVTTCGALAWGSVRHRAIVL